MKKKSLYFSLVKLITDYGTLIFRLKPCLFSDFVCQALSAISFHHGFIQGGGTVTALLSACFSCPP